MKQDFDPNLLIEAIFEQSIADYIKHTNLRKYGKVKKT